MEQPIDGEADHPAVAVVLRHFRRSFEIAQGGIFGQFGFRQLGYERRGYYNNASGTGETSGATDDDR